MIATGSLVHFSIRARDLSAAAKFYGELFGWKFRRMTDTYWLTVDSVGSLSLEKETASPTMPILYFSVASIDEGLAAVGAPRRATARAAIGRG